MPPESPDDATRDGVTGPSGERGFDRAVADHWVLSIGLAILTVVLLRFRSAVDADAWLHLRIGRELRSGEWFGVLPDPLVALADRAYTPTQWLSEIVGTFAFDAGGVIGLRALRLLALLVLLGALYLAARRWMPPARATGVMTIVGFCTAAAWAERPQMAGLALGALTVLFWGATIEDGRPRWALVPVTWLWAMFHGTWALGLAFGAVALVALLVSRRGSARWNGVIGVLGACVAVVAATPLGPRLLIEPFAVTASARPGVNEWQPSSFTNPLYVLVLVLAAGVVVRAVRRRPVDAAAVVLALAAAGMAAYSVRTVAFGALLLVPALGRGLRSTSPPRLTRREAGPLLVAAVAIAVAPGVVWGAPSSGPLGRSVDAALAALPPRTQVAVDLGVSGWVLHEHPGVVPLRDLRAEIYTAGTGNAYEVLDKARPGWQEYVSSHDVALVLAKRGEPLDRALTGSAGWAITADDGTYRLWRRG